MKFHTSPIDILISETKLKIVEFLLTHQASMSEREIASILKISHMSINRTLRELAEINLVTFTTSGKAHLWSVNHNSYAYNELTKLIKGISDIKDPFNELIDTILRNIPKRLVEKIILFGSIVKGTERTNSDIDIFILVKYLQGKDKLEPAIEKLSNICLDKYGNRLAPYILDRQELDQKKNLRIISEINKGIEIFSKKDCGQ
jgi:predicted nucleotidyltransferase